MEKAFLPALKQHKKFTGLQISRGIAALLVVFDHITVAYKAYYKTTLLGGFFYVGWAGVDFFFVLSGFIIYYVHNKDFGQPKQLGAYAAKRFIRIYPVYWIIAGVFLLMMLFNGNNLTDAAATSARLHNAPYLIKSFLLIYQQGYPFLGVAWTLCYEVFFYLVFGLAIIFGVNFLRIAIAVYLLLFACKGYLPFLQDSFFVSNYHIEFIIGLLVGELNRRFTIKKYALLITIGIIGFASSWVYIYTIGEAAEGMLLSRLLLGASAALIILGCSYQQGGGNGKLYQFFTTLGDASYVLYLLHPVMLVVIFKICLKLSANMAVAGVSTLVVAIISALLFHLYIEKPLLAVLNKKWGRK